MEIVQIVVIGMVGALLSMTLKNTRPEYSLIISLATGVLLFFLVIGSVQQVIDILKNMADKAGVQMEYLGIIFKIIGIAYIAEFGIQLCADAGEKSIASKIELAGKILIMVISAPVLAALLTLVLNMVS